MVVVVVVPVTMSMSLSSATRFVAVTFIESENLPNVVLFSVGVALRLGHS